MGLVRARTCQGALLCLLVAGAGCSKSRSADGSESNGGGSDAGTVGEQPSRTAGMGAAAGRGGRAGGGSGRGGASGSGRVDDDVPESNHALAGTCRQTCAAAEPAPPDTPDCENDSVESCERICAKALADTDAACAQCKLDHIEWLSASGGCGGWECACLHGSAEFPSEQGPPCMSACESTLDRRAQTRAEAPVPSSLGRAPDALVELTQVEALTGVAIGGDQALWLSGVAGDEAGPAVWLLRLDAAMAVEHQLEPPSGDWPGRRPFGLLAAPNGDALIGTWTGEVNKLARFDPSGSLVFDVELVPALFDLAASDLGWTPTGNVMVTLIGAGNTTAIALRSGGDGSALGDSTKLDTATLSSVSKVGIDAQGRYRVAGSDHPPGMGSPGVLVSYENAGSELAPQLNEIIRTHFDGDQLEGHVQGFAAHADGSAAVFGWVRRVRPTSTGTVDGGNAFVAKVAPDGREQWRFEHEGIVQGRVSAVAMDEQGNVYATSQEDPVEYAQDAPSSAVLCAAYGCSGLVVRKWSPSGELLWEYQHREATSGGYALALDRRGRLFVAGGVRRERSAGLLLRFDPE